jgi:catechol 2,3-dioxygenase-like lactoylglutathione lyase family enzyme
MATKKAKKPAKKAAAKRAPKKAAGKTAAKRKAPSASRARAAAPAPPVVVSRSTPAERRRQFPEALRLRGLSASLTVDDLAKSLKFYVDGLGFTIKDRWERDGKLLGVMLVAGACEIGLSQDDWAKGRNRVKGVGVRFHAETGQSLDMIAALAQERGIKADGPKVAPWGDRVVDFEDPDGYKLTILWPK